MKQVIDLQEYSEEVYKIKRFQAEADGRARILSIMVESGMNNSENFSKYFSEYLDYCEKFNIAKNEFVNNTIAPKVNGTIMNWSIFYDDMEIVLDVKEV